jgi:hypothetical protein
LLLCQSVDVKDLLGFGLNLHGIPTEVFGAADAITFGLYRSGRGVSGVKIEPHLNAKLGTLGLRVDNCAGKRRLTVLNDAHVYDADGVGSGVLDNYLGINTWSIATHGREEIGNSFHPSATWLAEETCTQPPKFSAIKDALIWEDPFAKIVKIEWLF